MPAAPTLADIKGVTIGGKSSLTRIGIVRFALIALTVTSGLALLTLHSKENGYHPPTIAITLLLLIAIAVGGYGRLLNGATSRPRRLHIVASILYATLTFLTISSLGAYLWPSALLAMAVLFLFRDSSH